MIFAPDPLNNVAVTVPVTSRVVPGTVLPIPKLLLVVFQIKFTDNGTNRTRTRTQAINGGCESAVH